MTCQIRHVHTNRSVAVSLAKFVVVQHGCAVVDLLLRCGKLLPDLRDAGHEHCGCYFTASQSRMQGSVRKRCLRVLVCSVFALLCVHAADWQLIHNTSTDVWGNRRTPPVRFSHASAVLHDRVVITHGFFYDVEARAAQWLSDTWSLAVQSPHTWRKLHNGVDAAAAAKEYSRRNTPAAPCGRYGASAVVYKQQMWLFGGTDGGFSKKGRDKSKPGADMDELYVYNPEEHAWAFIRPRGKKPAPRYLHTAVVVADAMLVFGGTEQTAGDVWSFSFKKLAWTRLSHAVGLSKGGPGSLYAHCAVAAADSTGFIVHGGRHVDGDLTDVMWFFNIKRHTWHKLPVHVMHHSNPPSRFFHAMAEVPLTSAAGGTAVTAKGATAALIVGGSIRSPVLLCSTETWLLFVDPHTNDQIWRRLPDLPYGIHYHQVVVHQQAAFVTAGHLCSEVKQHTNLPHLYLNHVLRLDLSFWLGNTASDAQHKPVATWQVQTQQ